ncbi:MAG: glycosyltransferase family 2 protein [Kiritimatiellae bacterium]|nr:glycosyltransferase family 2 protein [Kiritimatiellia bacterium]MCO5067385.1 glycosyltransferase family 2 protein [Kiritimatiellia bacterium]
MTPPTPRERISACVIVFNEEKKIRRCLESLTWCDEIVVLDSYSTDNTVEICREYTDRIFLHVWLGYVGQRNKVRTLARYNWILNIDSDEEISPGLRDEILAEFDSGTPQHLGYEFPRQVYYLGKWIHHGEWYPDAKLRLFHKDFGRSEGEEPHDKVVVNGPIKRLKNPLWHYTYDDLRDHLDTLDRFSTISARQKFVQDPRARPMDLLTRPPLRFLKGYILKHGFLDGWHGLIIAITSSFGVFMKYAKLWELALRKKQAFRQFPDPGTGPGSQAS